MFRVYATKRGMRVEKALIELQRAATADEVWKASIKLMRATLRFYQVMMGLPSFGITPLFMRSTLAIPNLDRFAELAPLNHATRDRPQSPIARMSDHYEPDTPNGRAFHDEFLQPMGWRYGAALLFWKPDGRFLGQLAVIRTEAQGDFTDLEMEDLRALHPHVQAVVERLLALEERFAAHLSMEHAINALPLPVLVASWEGEVNYANGAGLEAMAVWDQSHRPKGLASKPARKLPTRILNGCMAQKKAWQEATAKQQPSETRRTTVVDHPSNRDISAEIHLVPAKAGRALQPAFAIHFHLAPAPTTEVARALARLSKLTSAEHETARRAAAGDNNALIAQRLGISVSTVRTHLRSVFRKLNISSRSRLTPLYQAFQSLKPRHSGQLDA